MQSEIGLMLPTATPGLCSRDGEKPHKRDGDFSFKVKANVLFFFFSPRQINDASLPKIFSHLARGTSGRYGTAACIADP